MATEEVCDAQLQSWLQLAKALARRAGDVIRAAAVAERRRSAASKASAGAASAAADGADLVTEFDRRNESIIVEAIRASCPADHRILAEESASPQRGENAAAACGVLWVVDPIDGTTNFVAGLRDVAVSIALLVDGRARLGVVYAPLHDELFHALAPSAAAAAAADSPPRAFLNDLPIEVNRDVDRLSRAVVCTEFGYQRGARAARAMAASVEALLRDGVRSVRVLGSGVLDLCYLACGRLDAVYAGVAGEGWMPWDHAAASLIVEAAGGQLRAVDGGGFDIFGDSVLACASAPLLGEMLERLSAAAAAAAAAAPPPPP